MQYLFGLLFSKNAKQSHTKQKILQPFLPCLKKKASQKPLKIAVTKISFPSGYSINTTCFE